MTYPTYSAGAGACGKHMQKGQLYRLPNLHKRCAEVLLVFLMKGGNPHG